MENKIIRDEKGRITKGSILNPEGTKVGSISIHKIIKRRLAEVVDWDGKRELAEVLVDRMLMEAIKNGDKQLMMYITNIVDGMPTQKTELTGRDGKDLQPVLVKFLTEKKDGNVNTE